MSSRTKADLQEALERLGVPWSPDMKKAELQALYEQALEPLPEVEDEPPEIAALDASQGKPYRVLINNGNDGAFVVRGLTELPAIVEQYSDRVAGVTITLKPVR